MNDGVSINKNMILAQGIASTIITQMNSPMEERDHLMVFSLNWESHFMMKADIIGFMETMGAEIDDVEELMDNPSWRFDGFEVFFEVSDCEVNMLSGMGEDKILEEDDNVVVWFSGDEEEVV